MSPKTGTRDTSLGKFLWSRWSSFARTPSGDMLATVLTIVVMFGAMFGCVGVVVLGTDGIELLFGLR